MSDRPTAWEGLKQQRKFLVFLIVMIPIGFAILLAGTAIFIAMLRGRVSLEAGITLITGTLTVGTFAAVGMGWKLVDGIVKEDVAKTEAAAAPKGPSTVIAAGEGAKASSTTEVERLATDTIPVIITESVSTDPSDVSASDATAVTPVDNPQKRQLKPE